jgi:hypothetical protein
MILQAMPAQNHSTPHAGPMADRSPLSLIDVLSVPTVGAAVLSCLHQKQALRRTCSAICALVRHSMVG